MALTLQDLVSHVMDAADLSDNPIDVRRAVRSSIWGYEQATTRHQWVSYDSEFTAFFNELYNTGTISIDASGVVTLAGGTFPSWAALGSIFIGDEKSYRVLSRDSDTQVTLEDWSGQSLADSAYTLRQDRVIMPDDVREIYDVWNETEDWSLRVVSPNEFRDYDLPKIYSGADPYLVTFRSVVIDGDHKTEMRVSPAVSQDTELNVAYYRRPRRPSILVSKIASAASSAVTLSNPLPKSASAVGAIVRYAGDIPPTADQQFGIQFPMLATFEGVVSAQASTTQITVPGIPDFTSKSIVITDVLDIPQFLMNAVRLYAEAQMCRIGRNDMKMYQAVMQAADDELRFAMEQDGPIVRRSYKPILRVDSLQSTPYIVES